MRPQCRLDSLALGPWVLGRPGTCREMGMTWLSTIEAYHVEVASTPAGVAETDGGP